MSTTYAARRTTTLRLTRRGRVVVFALALIWVLAAFWLFSSGSVATDEPEATTVVMVGTGDTLWDIAAEHADDGDVLEMMDHIKDLNDLDSGSLQAGQKLRVPAGRLHPTDFVSRLDPGWRAGEDEGRGYPRGSLAPRGHLTERRGSPVVELVETPLRSDPWPATQAPRW